MTQELTPQELKDLYRAQAINEALNRWSPQSKQEVRISSDSKELLRLAVRIVNANYEELDGIIDELDSFLR